MKRSPLLHYCLLSALLLPVFGLRAADEVPNEAKLLVNDPLDESTFKAHWKKAKGKFAIENGIFTAREILEEHHQAGAGRIEAVMNGILEVEFNPIDSEELQFGFDYTTDAKKDHLLRAVLKEGTVSARAGSGWGPTTKMKPFGPKPRKIDVAQSQWHRAVLEFFGQEVVIRIDGKTVFAAAAGTPLEGVEKNRIALTARGVAQFRNLKLWSLENFPAEKWAQRFESAKRQRD